MNQQQYNEQVIKETDKKRRAYQKVFNSELGQEVLKDLAQFCGAHRDLFSRCPYEMAHNTGARKVLLRIQNMLNVDDQQIWELFENERRKSGSDG